MEALNKGELDRVCRSVRWIGRRSDVLDILAASDVVVLPTYYREGIPRVLLEAASMGLPLVATAVPGCTEVVEDGSNGFLVPARDPEALAASILRLARDPAMRRRLGARSREIAVAHAREGIRANALCPGPVNTPLLEELLADPAARARRLVHVPMGRLAEAGEVARAALFLASDEASYVNGATFLVDGGISGAYVTPE